MNGYSIKIALHNVGIYYQYIKGKVNAFIQVTEDSFECNLPIKIELLTLILTKYSLKIMKEYIHFIC